VVPRMLVARDALRALLPDVADHDVDRPALRILEPRLPHGIEHATSLIGRLAASLLLAELDDERPTRTFWLRQIFDQLLVEVPQPAPAPVSVRATDPGSRAHVWRRLV